MPDLFLGFSIPATFFFRSPGIQLFPNMPGKNYKKIKINKFGVEKYIK